MDSQVPKGINMHKLTNSFFDNYLPQPTEHTLSNNEVIQIKKLSYGEAMAISNKSIKSIGADGTPEIDFEAAQKAKYEKISRALVQPKLTVLQLLAMDDTADEIIDEIYAIVDPKTAEAIAKSKEEAEEE